MHGRILANKKGITLIALVVTIIVLLILAGISISMLAGENGIITRAAEAKEKTEDASDLEYLRTEAYSALLSYYASGSTLSESEYVLDALGAENGNGITTNKTTGTVTYNGKTYNISELLGNSNEQNAFANNKLTQITDSPLLTENENIRMVLQEETEDGKTLQAVIPVGFYYVDGTISGGMVISDVNGDDINNSKGGNQFVWVPCDGEYLTYEAENGLGATWKEKYAKNSSGEYTSYQYYYTKLPDTTNASGEVTAEGAPIDASVWSDTGGDTTSVQKYGGFYIARFEAGVPSDASFYANSDGATYATDSSKNADDVLNLKPVSKKNNQAWNYISQEKAVTVSANMYANSSSVTSSLVDSYAWDTIVEWMEKNEIGIAKNCNNRGNYSNSSFTVNDTLYAYHRYNGAKRDSGKSSSWTPATTYKKGILTTGSLSLADTSIRDNYEFTGYDDTNYTYTLYKEIATGSAEETKINNIYDMAGNMWEWTTEIGYPNGATERAVLCGGSFIYGGSGGPVCYRYGGYAALWSGPDVGFRVVLYIK